MALQQLNGYPLIVDATRERTGSLLGKVLGITALGFFVTAVGVNTAPPWSMLPGIIAVFALIFAINFTKRKSPGVALALFMGLAYFMGWEIAPIIHRYVAAIGTAVVFNAALTTGLGMAAMGCVAYLFNINYRRVAGIATGALLVLILAGVASMFFHFITPDTYSFLALAIFSVLTVADFARIRAGGDGQSATVLALSIYLDGINIFLSLLQILGGRSERRS